MLKLALRFLLVLCLAPACAVDGVEAASIQEVAAAPALPPPSGDLRQLTLSAANYAGASSIERTPMRARQPNFFGMFMPIPINVGDAVLSVSLTAAGPAFPTPIEIRIIRTVPTPIGLRADDFVAAVYTGVIADPAFQVYTIPVAVPAKLKNGEAMTLYVNGLDVAFGNVQADYLCGGCPAF